jgi:L-fuconolactonase
MNIVDAHCHVSPVWYEPVETLLYQMDRVGVAQAILIQLLGQFDNSYQQECIRLFPHRFASVVAVNPQAGDAGEQLQQLMSKGASGLRMPAIPQADSERVDALWRTAVELKVPLSCVGTATQFTSAVFARRLASAADNPVVLEHLGGIARPDFDGNSDTLASVMALKRFSQVHLKLPGLGQLGKRTALSQHPPIEASAAALLLQVATHFGPDRMMWGSDFPPVATREGYANSLAWPADVLRDWSENQRAAAFGANARRVFRLGTT